MKIFTKLIAPVSFIMSVSLSASAFDSRNAVQIANSSNPFESASSYIKNLFRNKANEQKDKAINNLEKSIVKDSDFTHIEINIGEDVFDIGNSANETKTKSEIIGVYRLHEDKNQFIFNQTSLVNYNDRQTINLGLGIREINDSETIIYGGNIFYDYELDSKHDRIGLGLEYINSLGEVRFNKYKALSDELTYKGIKESALDGHDFRVKYNLPYLYSSSIFFNDGKWTDGKGYDIDTKEWGVKLEPIENFHISVANQQQDSTKDKNVASISYVIPFGSEQSKRVMQNGDFTAQLKNVRKSLYKPVERENRIMKKSIKLGVTASGY